MSVREQLVALAKLGRIDASTFELDRELKEIPKEVDQLRESVALLEGLLAKERNELDQAQKLGEQQGEALREANDALSRAKQKAAKAKNAREAEAVERELDANRRSIKDREGERDRLTAAIAQVSASLQQHESEFAGLKEMLAQKSAEAEARIAELEAKRKVALHGRDDLLPLIPREILSRYDAIRTRRLTGVAEVRDGICQGCRMAVRPMQFIVIQREEGVERCAHCQRFLYWGPWLVDENAQLEAGEAGEPAPTREEA
ncbi:MAG TPA: C4-type zinc ribbon domain-containing protein [Polyangiales bacterium]